MDRIEKLKRIIVGREHRKFRARVQLSIFNGSETDREPIIIRKARALDLLFDWIISGREVSAEEVIEEVLKDKAFYGNSGGGMTLSGGEPIFNSE